MLITWLTLASCIMLVAPQSLTGKFQLTFARVFDLPLSIGRSICTASFAEHPSADLVSNSRYVKLRNHLANTLQQLKEQHKKVEELSGLRDRFAWQGVKFVMADAVVASNDSQHHLVINRGSDEGLASGQFVLCNNCVVGTICDVGEQTAKVQLVTDPKSRIAATIGDLDVSTILLGEGNGRLKIGMLPIRHKVTIDDPVYAMAKPGLLNTPVIIGTVSSCRKDSANPLLWDVEVTPACDLDKMYQVSVVVGSAEQ